MLVVLQAVPSLVMRPSAVHRAPVPLMVTEQQTFVSKVAQGALASAVALQLAQPVPVGALSFEAPAPTSITVPAPSAAPVDAAPAPAPAPSAVAAPAVATEAAAAEAARAARAEVEAAEAEAAVAKAEAVAAAAAQKAYAGKLAAEQGYDAAYAAALKKVEAEAAVAAVTKAEPPSDMLGGFMSQGKGVLSKAGEMTGGIAWPEQTTPASTDSEDFLSGVGGKGVILPLIAGFAVLSLTESVFNRMVDENARKTGGKLSANEIYEASKSTGIGSDWLKAALSNPNEGQAAPGRGFAPAPAAPYAGAGAPAAAPRGQQRSAPDILFAGLGNLGKDPMGWCYGPPSSLYSNAGSESTASAAGFQPPAAGFQPPAAGFQPPAAGFQPPAAGGRASQPYAAPAGTEAKEATRDGEEDAAKAAWLANAPVLASQNRVVQPPAQQPWQASAPTPAPPYAAAPAAPYAGAGAPAAAPRGQQRSAPDILFAGLGNLGKDPMGWCYGPPSSLYSNAGSESTASAAGFQPPAAGFQPPAAGGRASQPYAAPAGTEATRDGEEDAAKAAWLANQNSGTQPPAQQPWQAQTAPEPWNLSPNGPPAAQAPQQQAQAPQQAEDAAPKGYLQDPGSWSVKK
jgi:hypothetical protein